MQHGNIEMATGAEITNLAAADANGKPVRYDEFTAHEALAWAGDPHDMKQMIASIDLSDGNELFWAYIKKADTTDPAVVGNWSVDTSESDSSITIDSIASGGIRITLTSTNAGSVKGAMLYDSYRANARGILIRGDGAGAWIIKFLDGDGVALSCTSASLGTGAVYLGLIGILTG